MSQHHDHGQLQMITHYSPHSPGVSRNFLAEHSFSHAHTTNLVLLAPRVFSPLISFLPRVVDTHIVNHHHATIHKQPEASNR